MRRDARRKFTGGTNLLTAPELFDERTRRRRGWIGTSSARSEAGGSLIEAEFVAALHLRPPPVHGDDIAPPVAHIFDGQVDPGERPALYA